MRKIAGCLLIIVCSVFLLIFVGPIVGLIVATIVSIIYWKLSVLLNSWLHNPNRCKHEIVGFYCVKCGKSFCQKCNGAIAEDNEKHNRNSICECADCGRTSHKWTTHYLTREEDYPPWDYTTQKYTVIEEEYEKCSICGKIR